MKLIPTKELRSLNVAQLQVKIDELRRSILELQLQVVTKHVPAFSSTKRALEKSVARALTIQRESLFEGIL